MTLVITDITLLSSDLSIGGNDLEKVNLSKVLVYLNYHVVRNKVNWNYKLTQVCALASAMELQKTASKVRNFMMIVVEV